MIGDLHCHTTLSDGTLGIEEIIIQAKRTGIDFVSITDHDTMSSISRAKVLGERHGVLTIPGVELSAWDKKRGRKVHILCYNPQKPERLEGICKKSCEIRTACAKEMIDNVIKQYPITVEAVARHVGGAKSIFKQHIMHTLIEYGYSNHFYGRLNDELFNMKTGSCYVEREYPEVNYVLDLIHSSRGCAVMAHPVYYDSFELLEELIQAGKIDGIEVDHYTANDEQRNKLRKLAQDNDLIITGGSDFHGLYNACPTHIGSETTDEDNLNRILKLTRKK